MTDDPPNLYTPAILEHARKPRHRGPLPDATHVGEGHNPMCGDRITVRLRVDGVVQAIAWEGDGCSIMVASASIMSAGILNERIGLAQRASERAGYNKWGFFWSDRDNRALEAVVPFPTRHKCAALPWEALREALSRT